MISSTMPSAKYSCSGSPLMFWNGSTAIDGLSGSARRCSCSEARPSLGQANPIDPDRPCDVLEVLLADILEAQVEPVPHLSWTVARNANAARLRQRFEPGRDVDAVAVDVAVLDDDVAEIDADAEFDPLRARASGVALGHALLHGHGAGDRFDDARELDQHAVAGRLDDAALVLGDFGSISSRRCARSRASVPASSSPISRL